MNRWDGIGGTFTATNPLINRSDRDAKVGGGFFNVPKSF
jgi:hypothetical protein